jgi:tRNA A37 threonylcarbamoyltransferase TsaD
VINDHSNNFAIYIDESGDLGFAPGSSKFFVIVCLVTQCTKSALIKRCVRKFKKNKKLSANVELKASNTKLAYRNEFCRSLSQLPCSVHYIVVDKSNVRPELRRDTNILYNYMAGLLMAPVMAKMDNALVHLDSRTIKVASGNSLSEYLRIKLWYEMKSSVNVEFAYLDSRKCLGIQAADMVSNAVFRYYENKDSSGIKLLQKLLKSPPKKLFFVGSTNKKRHPAGG